MTATSPVERRYLVVGASGTIGAAVAARLAEPGVALGLHWCTSADGIQRISAEVTSAGALGLTVQSALDSEAACARMFEQLDGALGPLTGMAICGGRVPWREWTAVSEADWGLALQEHCVIPFTLARLAVSRMPAGGSIVYLSSIAAKYGGSSRTMHYAAAKSALETAMRGLARETASAGIRINGVRAGLVQTPQQVAGRSPEEIRDRIEKIPMRRAGLPQEIAHAIAFLLSTEATFMTGEIITVAGGD